jgi:hypothetical protein
MESLAPTLGSGTGGQGATALPRLVGLCLQGGRIFGFGDTSLGRRFLDGSHVNRAGALGTTAAADQQCPRGNAPTKPER